ncbi:MAG TPA: contact-dependent growth inhibition system immunity protein, partial [Tepidisphaeraceae bacterium]|nr:contact-dependent growth inhibition system immunity protein [Tepidisphaeraceae bacterium]
MTTFRQIDEAKGVTRETLLSRPSAIGNWYIRVRDVPLDELTTSDICRAVRQKTHLDYVVPIALHLLEQSPLAGELYEGELLLAFDSLPEKFWQQQLNVARD